MDDQETADQGEHHREEVRASMFLQAHLRRPDDATAITVRVRNLSAGGLMADCPVDFVRGEAVEVDIRGIGPITGRIAWRTEERVGIAFDVHVDPTLARKTVAAAKPAPIFSRPPTSVRRPGLRID